MSSAGQLGRSARDPHRRRVARNGVRPLTEPAQIEPGITSPNGGSMMRIYRDIRFSKDKSPYKTFVAAHFSHAKGKEAAAPVFYLHLAPGESVVGGGIWQPEPKALKKIRDKIAGDPKGWGPSDHGWCPWLNMPHGRRIAEAAASRLRPGLPVHRRHQAQGLRHQHSADRSGSDRRQFSGSGASETPRQRSFRAVLVECRRPVLRCYGHIQPLNPHLR